MTVLLVISALVCLSAAEYPVKDSPHVVNGYDQSTLAALLDLLRERVEVRQEVQAIQYNRLEVLTSSVNANFDSTEIAFINLRDSAFFETDRQNFRLDALEKRLLLIGQISKRLSKACDTVEKLQAIVDKQQEIIKKDQEDISCFQNGDIDIADNVRTVLQRNEVVLNYINVQLDNSADNNRSLNQGDFLVRNTIRAVNKQGGLTDRVSLRPNSFDDNTFIDFSDSFFGTPQWAAAYPIGLNLRNPQIYDSYGKPTIYFSVEQNLMSTGAQLRAVDMSSDNWQVDYLVVSAAFNCFDRTFFPKEPLDSFVTSFFP